MFSLHYSTFPFLTKFFFSQTTFSHLVFIVSMFAYKLHIHSSYFYICTYSGYGSVWQLEKLYITCWHKLTVFKDRIFKANKLYDRKTGTMPQFSQSNNSALCHIKLKNASSSFLVCL